VSGGANYLPTLTHEIVHSLMQTDFPSAPLWINEAIASLFEAPVFSKDGGIHGVRRNWRHDQLKDALADVRTRDKVRMDTLFRMNGIEFRAISDDRESVDKERNLLHCAVARAFAAWMDEQEKLWPFYRAWRDGFAADPTGEKAFAVVMGASPEVANARWLAWVR
jgi:hypothetical protein